MLTVLIVDSFSQYRQELADLFGSQPDFALLGEASSLGEAMEKVAGLQPQLVLLGDQLPDCNSVDAAQTILLQVPKANIIFLTDQADDERLFAAIRAGAKGYLLKDLAHAQLLAALRSIQQGQAPISRSVSVVWSIVGLRSNDCW